MTQNIGYYDTISKKIVDAAGETLLNKRFNDLASAEAYARHYTDIQLMGHYRSMGEVRELLDGLLAVA